MAISVEPNPPFAKHPFEVDVGAELADLLNQVSPK
jgi:hypothetical protein